MTKRAPVLFIGHGSPMNAIERNAFTDTLSQMGKTLERPEAILCISAHWITSGSWVTNMASPRTIHDFYGFPQELFDVQYPAPGSPEIASRIKNAVAEPNISLDDHDWGIDHGTWSVLRHMYPDADIPVLQLSIDMSQPSAYHVEIGQQIKSLRDKNIMIVGSGNIVHNLRRLNWDENAGAFDWAIEFDEWAKEKLVDRDFNALMNGYHASESGKLSVPTTDHYLPLLYTISATDPADDLTFNHEGIDHGSISMRTLTFSS